VTSLFLPFNLAISLTVKCLSVIVRGCLWLADRLAYVVLKLEAKNEH
jgi:hypothetical protein